MNILVVAGFKLMSGQCVSCCACGHFYQELNRLWVCGLHAVQITPMHDAHILRNLSFSTMVALNNVNELHLTRFNGKFVR